MHHFQLESNHQFAPIVEKQNPARECPKLCASALPKSLADLQTTHTGVASKPPSKGPENRMEISAATRRRRVGTWRSVAQTDFQIPITSPLQHPPYNPKPSKDEWAASPEISHRSFIHVRHKSLLSCSYVPSMPDARGVITHPDRFTR